MELYLCEKPSQAKDLSQALGASVSGDGRRSTPDGSVVVTWCVGHLLELYEPQQYDEKYRKWNFGDLPIIPEHYRLEVKEGAGDQYRVVTGLIKQADSIVISTDFDREGEAIARSVMDRCRYQGRIRRLCLTALDQRSISIALNNIRDGSETINMYYAALARQRADWLVGMNLSRLYTLIRDRKEKKPFGDRKKSSPLAVGRVMTPTVILVVERDRKIANFVSEPFYDLTADVMGGNIQYRVKYIPKENLLDENGRVKDRNALQAVMNRVKYEKPVVQEFNTKLAKQRPPLPFDLNTLQQFCNKKFGYTAEKTLSIAQSLYETRKATSYPRTDCRYLPEEQLADASRILEALKMQEGPETPEAQEKYIRCQIRKGKAYDTSKITAHHAIVPTGADFDIAALSPDERAVYEVIKRAFIAQFYPDAIYECSSITLECCGEKFAASCRYLREPGWRVLYGDDAALNNYKDPSQEGNAGEEDPGLVQQKLPRSVPGSVHTWKDFGILDRKTTPPAHFTEATLLYAMEHVSRYIENEEYKKVLSENAGIGTPATRAEIISSAKGHDYLKEEGKYLRSTPKAESLLEYIPEELSSAGMTAAWEQGLEQISRGGLGLDDFMKRIEGWVTKLVEGGVQGLPPEAIKDRETPRDKCPVCGCAAVLRKRKKDGKPFWVCESKKCGRFFDDKDGKPALRPGDEASAGKDPASSSSGRKDPAGSPAPAAGSGIVCPDCGAPMILRNGKKGEFYGCSRFPKCRKIIDKEKAGK